MWFYIVETYPQPTICLVEGSLCFLTTNTFNVMYIASYMQGGISIETMPDSPLQTSKTGSLKTFIITLKTVIKTVIKTGSLNCYYN